MSRKSSSSWVSAAVAVGLSSFPLASAHAEQFTFFDMTYTATEQNSNTPARGHYDFKEGGAVKLTQPDNWTSPIDYTKGTVVIELDAMTKPSDAEAQIDVCFLTSKGYGCRNTPKYTKPGRYQVIRPMPSGFYAFDKIDWTKKITHVQLVTKDGANNNGGTDLKKFFPHTSRIAISFVSPGGTYVLPAGWTPAPGTDGGVAPGNADAATSADADAPALDGSAVTPDAAVPPPAVNTGGTSGAAGGTGGSSATAGSGGSSGSSGGTGGSSPTSPTSGSGGRTGPAPTTTPAEAPSAAGGPCMMVQGQQPALPGTLALLAVGLVALARRRRRG